MVFSVAAAAPCGAADTEATVPFPDPDDQVAHLGRFHTIPALACDTRGLASVRSGRRGITVRLPGAAAGVWLPRGNRTCETPLLEAGTLTGAAPAADGSTTTCPLRDATTPAWEDDRADWVPSVAGSAQERLATLT